MRGHLRRFATVGLFGAALLGVAGSSSGDTAGPWSAPQQLFSQFGVFPQAGIDAHGTALVAFESYRPGTHGPTPGTTRLLVSERRPGHAFAAAHQVGRAGSFVLLRLAENPAGAVAILLRQNGSSCTLVGGPCRSTLKLLYRPAGGRFRRAETVAENPSPFQPIAALGLDDHGDVTVVWQSLSRHEVLARYRPAHRRFERAQLLGRSGATLPDLGVNERGDAVAAWSQPTRQENARGNRLSVVRAARRHAGRSRFGRAETVSQPSEIGEVAAAEGPRRDSLVGWIAHGPLGPPPTYQSATYANAAYRPPRGRFEQPHVLGQADLGLAVALNAAGAGLAHWIRITCGAPCPTPSDMRSTPQVAFRASGEGFGPPSDFGLQDGGIGFAPYGRDGWLAVEGRDQQSLLAMTVGPRGSATSPTTTITSERTYGGSGIATNGRGDAVIAWNANGQDSRVRASVLER